MQPFGTVASLDPAVGTLLQALAHRTATALGVAAIAVLLGLSAFFASAEIAIFSLGNHRISTLVEDGVRGAGTLDALKSNPRRLLVTILVGNNVANIGMSAVATGLLGLYLTPGQSVLAATFGITSLVLLFGESTPKAYGVEHSESWALRVARPLRAAQVLLYPLVVVFDVLTRWVNRLLGSSGEFEAAYVTRAEIADMIAAGQREGVFTDEEHLMLQRLLRFRNRIVKETMVPRLDVVGVPADADLATAVRTAVDSGFGRLPIYEGTLDEVVGVVAATDLLAALEAGEDPTMRELATEPYVVPETKDVDELLAELRAERRRFAVIVDEFGTTAGIATIEDLVEEIVGEVLSETETVPIRWLADDVAVVRGELNVHEVNEALGTDLPEAGEYESMAGLLFHRAGRLVEEGESVSHDGVRLVAETVDNNRVLEVRVELPDAPAPGKPE